MCSMQLFTAITLLPFLLTLSKQQSTSSSTEATSNETEVTHQYGNIGPGPESNPKSCHTITDIPFEVDRENTYTMEFVLVLSQATTEKQFGVAKDFVANMTSVCASTGTKNWMNVQTRSDSFWCNDTTACHMGMHNISYEHSIVNSSQSPDFDDKIAENLVSDWLADIEARKFKDTQFAVVFISDFVSMRLLNTRQIMDRLNVSFYAFIVASTCMDVRFYETMGTPHLHTPYNFSGIDLHAELPCLRALPTTTDQPTTESTPKKSGIDMTMVLIIVTCILSVYSAFFVGICFCLWKKRIRKQRVRHLQMEQNWNTLRMQAMSVYSDHLQLNRQRESDKWEIDRSKLEIDYMARLGAGAFGSVYKGSISGVTPLSSIYGHIVASQLIEDCQVAVKILHEYADALTKSDFLQEINFMKNLGYHPHVVNMVACITLGEPILISELCSKGDLLRMVKGWRENIDEMETHCSEMMSFAWQISDGMTYLSSKGFVHRDLAARNILADANDVAKIGDFGLCRSVQNAIYVTKGGRLPIKWMAPESLAENQYTTKSDVWSFAVLLYEMYTFGLTPFPVIEPRDMLEHLNQGNRLLQPQYCPSSIFELMTLCWKESPEDRPTFENLRSSLTAILESNDSDNYLKVICSYKPSSLDDSFA